VSVCAEKTAGVANGDAVGLDVAAGICCPSTCSTQKENGNNRQQTVRNRLFAPGISDCVRKPSHHQSFEKERLREVNQPLWVRRSACNRFPRQPSGCPTDVALSACLSEAHFSLRNSISSPNNSGLRAFFVKRAATTAESLVSFGITLLTLRRVRRVPSLDNFQST
jgi:hypothetical protein